MMCWQRRRAGVEGLIEIENPNRVTQKAKKVSQIELDEPRQLSRRERCVLKSKHISYSHLLSSTGKFILKK